MQCTDWRVHGPVCGSTRIHIDENPDEIYVYHHVACSCLRCDATFNVVYKAVDIEHVRYGNPLGPVYLTDDPEDALFAYDAKDDQWIRTDGTAYAVGYSPTIADGRTDQDGWEDTSPEALEALLRQAEADATRPRTPHPWGPGLVGRRCVRGLLR